MFGWARSTGLNESDAADLLQEVFLLLLKKLPEFEYDREKGSFRHWLRVLTLNKLRDLRRKTQPTLLGSASELMVSEDADLGRFWDQEFQRQLVAQALQIMRRDFEDTSWKACWDSTFGGKSVAETATDLGISPGAVYVARCRVLRRLRQELEGIWE